MPSSYLIIMFFISNIKIASTTRTPLEKKVKKSQKGQSKRKNQIPTIIYG